LKKSGAKNFNENINRTYVRFESKFGSSLFNARSAKPMPRKRQAARPVSRNCEREGLVGVWGQRPHYNQRFSKRRFFMLIIPAIDLQGGQAVRLVQGDYGKKTVYNPDPVRVAKDFEEMGAKYLHVVDLDGAKDGNTTNIETIRKIRKAISIPMQLGGGIRNAETVSLYLNDIGINRVILGTVAVSQPEFVKEMLAKHGAEKIVIGVDVRNETVATAGWLADSNVNYLEFIEALKAAGAQYLVVTDISRDGTLTSPNWDMYEKIKGINFVVSGGVAEESHIFKAADYYAVIVGKAFYEGKVDLKKCFSQT
jgi:phosphoribosylformimino-5-aminoimidazole carboxamide ribotide isomerase